MNEQASAQALDGVRDRLPWAVFLFLLAVFALASFDPLLSVDYVARRDEPVEARLEASIERTEAGNVARRIAMISLGAFGLVSLMRRERNKLHVNQAIGYLTLLFLFWAALSILWSQDQALTFRRVVLLAMLCLGALAVAERFSYREITYFVFFTGFVTIVAGLLCEVVLGTFKPWDEEYRFAGLMNPIFQGAHCGMTIIAALALAYSSKRARFYYVLVALVALVFMLLTRSRGPAGATLVALVVLGSLASVPFRRVVLFALVPLVVVLMFTGLFARVEDVFLFGREVDREYETMGRIALWRECLEFSSDRPLLGYGYEAFWTRDFTFAVTDASGFTSQHTHNALLDLLLGIGIPGAVAYTLVVLLAMKALLARYRSSRSIHCATALALVILYALHNILVSVHLAAQLQTFAVLVVLAKVGFVQVPPESEQSEAAEQAVRPPAYGQGKPESVA